MANIKKEVLRKLVTMKIDPDVWDGAKKLLDPIGITRARFIEIQLRALLKATHLSMKDVMPGVFDDLADASLLGPVEKVKKKKTK